MNRYDFSCDGKVFTICFCNEDAENFISACIDLAKKGFTPDYWHNDETGKDVLMYADHFSIRKECPGHAGNRTSFEITPETLHKVCKSIGNKLSTLCYFDNGEWNVKRGGENDKA